MHTITVEKESRIGSDDIQRIFPVLEKSFQGTVLLETQTPGGNSILVWKPVATVTVHSGTVEVKSACELPLPAVPLRPALVPHFLQEVLDRFNIKSFEMPFSATPFIGGFVGFVGYEWAVGQEGLLSEGDPGIPDMWFGLYDRALIANTNGEVFLVAVHTMRNATVEEVRRELHDAFLKSGSTAIGGTHWKNPSFEYDFPKEKFEAGVREIKRLIKSGDVYQVNLAQRIRCRSVDPFVLYSRLRRTNPSPYGGIITAGGFTIVSNSPERLLKVSPAEEGIRWISTRPIAGTRPRSSLESDLRNERALRLSPKERAEHTMLVDLSRNDLGRIAQEGSVEVDELMTIERYSHVMHLVSNVKGKLSNTAGIPELFRALMPGGSVTGTPKISATRIISEIEPVPRGAYTGSMGYISLNGGMDFNILIRSAYYPGNSNEMHIYAGSGIVHDSVPLREWNETREKAKALLESITNAVHSGYAWAPPKKSSLWKPPAVGLTFPDSNVLLIDNYDSFTYNLVQYLSALGAHVTVVRNDQASVSEMKALDPTHLVISPGPGKPEDSGISIPAILAFRETPTMGVCLGHQAMVEAYGGSVTRARLPMHGKTSRVLRITHPGLNDMLKGLPSSFMAARYNSLLAEEVPYPLLITAKTEAGEVMAVQHSTLPAFGVQFHPESILTQNGLEIFSNFLASSTSGGRKK